MRHWIASLYKKQSGIPHNTWGLRPTTDAERSPQRWKIWPTPKPTGRQNPFLSSYEFSLAPGKTKFSHLNLRLSPRNKQLHTWSRLCLAPHSLTNENSSYQIDREAYNYSVNWFWPREPIWVMEALRSVSPWVFLSTLNIIRIMHLPASTFGSGFTAKCVLELWNYTNRKIITQILKVNFFCALLFFLTQWSHSVSCLSLYWEKYLKY